MAKRSGKPTALDDRPDLPEGFEWVWLGFLQLSSARSGGFAGPEAIRPEAILAWLELQALSSADVRAEFYRLVTSVDCAWRETVSKQPKQ